PFTLSPQPSVTVSPASPRTITLTCAPTTAGTFTTTVSVDATDASGSLPIAINATCEGSLQELYASPTTLQLGELRLDADPLVRTIQVLSTDPDAPLTLAGQPQLESPNPSVS